MKKIVSGLLLLSSISFATTYFAKVEPINSYTVKSSVSGKVIYANSALESKIAQNAMVVKLDDSVDLIELEQSQEKLGNMQQVLKLQDNTLESFKRVSSKSQFDRDNQKIVILNTASTINDLKTKIATLKDTIKNKNLSEKNSYIYDVSVEVGDYVTPGTLLYTAMDLSKGKVEIFIPIDDAATIQDKEIYLDDKKSDLKIAKLYDVADSKHISSYKCEIIIPSPEKFSKLVKIEFK
ncbi:MAG: HlyD family secretion protein [Arcobacteraceae bacterium]|nr:HlyD family secretion protein [Arcobacteraceae bacterium]